MLPYFEYTEDVQNFCQLMGFKIDLPTYTTTRYVCTYALEDFPTPLLTSYNLDPDKDPLIPSEKVFTYLTLMLNGYSHQKAVKELNVVGNGRSSSS